MGRFGKMGIGAVNTRNTAQKPDAGARPAGIVRLTGRISGDGVKHRILLCAGFLLAAVSVAEAKDAPGNSSYPFGDAGGSHYSALTQINAQNVHKLKQA